MVSSDSAANSYGVGLTDGCDLDLRPNPVRDWMVAGKTGDIQSMSGTATSSFVQKS